MENIKVFNQIFLELFILQPVVETDFWYANTEYWGNSDF